MRAKTDHEQIHLKVEVPYPKKEVTGASSRNLILTLRIMLTYCFRPLDHAGTSSNWGLRQTPNRRTMETVAWTIVLWIEALFVFRRRDQGVVGADLPQVLEGGPENLGQKGDRRDHNAAFGAL